MKAKGVLFCMAMLWSWWGGAHPGINEAPESFQLICPNDVTVYCDEDLSNLSKWGDAYVWKDYKKLSAGYPKIDDQRNTCGIGVITRTWRVEDPNWNWHTCTQTITVKGKGQFGYHDITWPDSWTVDTCTINLHPNNIPDRYSYPTFNRKDCAKPAYSYHDEYFEFGPHCAKLIRTWSVIDWCQYKPYPGSTEGKWEYIQIIKIDQKSKPYLECPKDTVFYAQDCDSAEVVLEDVIAISKCGDTLKVKNNSDFADVGLGNASGKYPIGVHEFYYTTEYGCGREAKCKMVIEVKPAKPPTPYCKNGIITTLMPMDTNNDGTIDEGMRDIWASDLNAGSYHSCYPNAKLTYSFSADTSDNVIIFTCQNLGRNEIEIWVTDEFGNQAYCRTYVMVQNNNPRLTDCMPDSLRTGTISGNLINPVGQSVKAVEMELYGKKAAYTVTITKDTTYKNGKPVVTTKHDTSWYDITKQDMAMDGNYAFKNLEMHKYYEVRAGKDDNRMNGVDIWDYYKLHFHSRGFFKLHDPIDLIAGDVNGDGRINQTDASLIFNAIKDPNAPNGFFESWRFFDEKSFDEYRSNWYGAPSPMMKIADLSDRKMDVNFVGVKIGDLNGDADPDGLKQNGTRSGDLAEVHMSLSNQGLDLKMTLDASYVAGDIIVEMQNAAPVGVISKNGAAQVIPMGDHRYRILWVHQSGLEELTLTLNTPNEGSEIKFELASIVYTESGESKGVQKTGNTIEKFELTQIAPNPVSDILHIDFFSPSVEQLEMTIFNVNGQILVNKKLGSFDYGQNRVSIDVESLPSGSAYYFRITDHQEVVVGNFIK